MAKASQPVFSAPDSLDAAVRPARRRRAPTWRMKLTVSLGSLLLSLCAVEWGLRLAGVRPRTATVLSTYFAYDRHTGWTGRPSAAGRFATTEFDVFVSHDLSGWRRPDPVPAPEAARSEVPVTWCLGDSGTWGWGVDDGQTYVDELNRLAAGREVFRNLGVCGYSTIQQLLMLEELLRAGQRPARVIALFCTNDLAENVDGRDQHPPRPYFAHRDGRLALENHPVRPSRGWNFTGWLKTHSRLYNRAHFALARAKLQWNAARRGGGATVPASDPLSTPMPHTDFSEPLPPLEREALAACYRGMRDACHAAGVDFWVALETRPQGQVSAICQELEVPVLDLGPGWQAALLAVGVEEPTSFPHDPHYNELGHKLLARTLWEELGHAPLANRPTGSPTAVR